MYICVCVYISLSLSLSLYIYIYPPPPPNTHTHTNLIYFIIRCTCQRTDAAGLASFSPSFPCTPVKVTKVCLMLSCFTVSSLSVLVRQRCLRRLLSRFVCCFVIQHVGEDVSSLLHDTGTSCFVEDGLL